MNSLYGFFSNNKGLDVYFYKTEDQSFSLRLGNNANISELMHSGQGAFSETLYVYEPVVKWVMENKLEPSFLVIGLGLGYLEILIVAHYLKNDPQKLTEPSFLIQSFESETKLISYFKQYFLKQDIPFLFLECYKNILEKISHYYNLSFTQLSNTVEALILKEKIVFANSFTVSSNLVKPVTGIFFDAFSSQSSPELWEIVLLQNILKKENILPACCFATYASRIILKKQLTEHNFKVKIRKGFMGKRECLFSVYN